MYHQADPTRTGSSAGLYRTFFYLGAISAAAANGAFLADRADTPGLHHLALFLGPCAVVFLAVTLADRSLRRIGGSKDADGASLRSYTPSTFPTARQEYSIRWM